MKQGVSINFYIGDGDVTRLSDSGVAVLSAGETPPPPTLDVPGSAETSAYAGGLGTAPPPPAELSGLESVGAGAGPGGPAPQLTPDSAMPAEVAFMPEMLPPDFAMEAAMGAAAPEPMMGPEAMTGESGERPEPPALEPEQAAPASKSARTRAKTTRRTRTRKTN